MKTEFSEENLEFWLACEEFKKIRSATKLASRAHHIFDEYIRSEKTGMRPSGLYRLGEDENGSPKIFFDDPRRADAAKVSGEEKGGVAPGCRGKDADQPAETCTGNTDRVDREIEKLKEEKKQLELQIQSASGDEKKVWQLEQRLAQVESELSQKDNETYRRQNTVFS